MASQLVFAGKTDQGLKRTNNEDNFVLIPSHNLFVLADGMGGHASGQVASSMCVSHVAQFICETSRQPGFELPYKTNPSLSREASILVNAIKFANERIYIQSCKERSMEGMGTTITAIYNAPHGLILAHVGDSRIYRVRNGQITQMSRDHSLMNHLLDTGELKPEDVAGFANKNVILRAIGLKENVEVDVKEVQREKGDIYMMCSDGLSDLVSDAQIAKAITDASNLNEACDVLIELALKAGGKDNVTVVCVGVETEDGIPSQQSTAVNRSSMQSVGAMNAAKPAAVAVSSAIPNVQPLGMGAAGQNGRTASQPSMTRAASYGTGLSAVTMPLSMPGHTGMALIPSRGMPMMPPQSQAVQTLRMHSVREVIEKIPASRASMPKPIGSGGRSSSNGMPNIPLMGKVRSGKTEEKPETEEMKQTVPMMQVESLENEDSGRPTIIDNPVLLDIPDTEMKEVSKLSEDAKSGLPETGLLFTEPPVGVKDALDSSNEVFEEDEDEDRTLIQRPEVFVGRADEILHDSASYHAPSKSVSASGEASSLGGSENTSALISPEKLEAEFSVSDSAVAARKVSASRGGYVPPKDIVLPPHHDYDEDDDNIEIAGILFGGDDEDDVTRQYRRPPFKKW